MRKYAKHWRDSASLIVAARNEGNARDADGFNYKVLVFKRTERTSYLPNHIVFPGGAFDPQDDSPQWLSLLAQQHVPEAAVRSVATVSGCRPYILQTTSDDTLDRNLSVRLCALRECFEELGVLLVANKNELVSATGSGFSRAREGFDVVSWQKDVHDGRKSFLELYSELRETPELWGLYEWSTWITPTYFPQRRFETAFFLAALDEIPSVFPEKFEVEEYMWASPRTLLEAHTEGNLWLAPPQAYELERLSYVHDIDVLVEFATKRKFHGTTPFCPVMYNTSDGSVGTLPGDDMYPKDFDFLTDNADVNKYVHLSTQEFADLAQNLHRVEHRGINSQTYLQNGQPVDGHLHLCGKNTGLSKL
ncbi:acyl-coenzyme A diphosphatase NUDT19-like [Anopheles ziemanni]|uniref:acyl-coenzyme A diphosphatase NUDT19-like n=1 Tax=Anopheles coustani TaxID=139045 RepID=UPI0026580AC8|nr:acyl-coenzyme A diphosphatase NUDT19-like [Anopheles coustani]XP_058167214.1 acyl-coenzyme A diphosphatase NUDT19-like [Anopheles ziemanni]